jgi:hypothetical protein
MRRQATLPSSTRLTTIRSSPTSWLRLISEAVAALILNGRERLPATVRGAVCTPYGEGCLPFKEDIVDHLRQLHFAPAKRMTSLWRH